MNHIYAHTLRYSYVYAVQHLVYTWYARRSRYVFTHRTCTILPRKYSYMMWSICDTHRVCAIRWASSNNVSNARARSMLSDFPASSSHLNGFACAYSTNIVGMRLKRGRFGSAGRMVHAIRLTPKELVYYEYICGTENNPVLQTDQKRALAYSIMECLRIAVCERVVLRMEIKINWLNHGLFFVGIFIRTCFREMWIH